ncbi:HNH endonuclease signature motif containing protein [Streptomyces galbus]|uniref:HNH endonuclease n=1 Tax=Streptomyces galbus TaxID=33898 RepID=A0A4U5X0X1_STRGB|nr:HNH endonuclease signature motif containing protein [Streptomyces galbus]TKT08300.1 HNH endonuclease [Streptomyces galbus]GHD46342.1 hypothetical protein GCM10010335_52870 [Streptomyces galbus]
MSEDVVPLAATGRRGSPPPADVMRRAVGESASLAEVLRRLGRADNTWQRAQVRRWIAEQHLDTSHFLGRAHQRGKPATNAKRPQDVLVRQGGGHRIATVRLRRALVALGVPERCVRCGLGPEWRGRRLTLEVDHVNGDRYDNRPENLRLLCPNCHAVTSTWCRGGRRMIGGAQ